MSDTAFDGISEPLSRRLTTGLALALRPTEAGRAEADQVRHWSDALLAAVGTLDDGEQAVLLRAVVKMIRALQEDGAVPMTRMCVTCRYFQPNAHDDPKTPHHCALVGAPFGDRHLRIDCAEHGSADASVAAHTWAAFSTHHDALLVPHREPPT